MSTGLSNLNYVFDQRTVHGAYFALSAYLFWGVAPVYFKWLDHVHPLEILIHRVIWSVVLLLVILIYTRQVGLLRISVRQTGVLFCSSMLLSVNWLIFIYAVTVGNIVEAALGYFINPLVSVLLAMLFLGERLRPLQLIALGLSGFGICIQLYGHGQVPLIALGLAFSFGFYGLIRKRLTMTV